MDLWWFYISLGFVPRPQAEHCAQTPVCRKAGSIGAGIIMDDLQVSAFLWPYDSAKENFHLLPKTCGYKLVIGMDRLLVGSEGWGGGCGFSYRSSKGHRDASPCVALSACYRCVGCGHQFEDCL